jgi:hypothetical protein
MSENEYLQVLMLAINAKIDTLIKCVAVMHNDTLVSNKGNPTKIEKDVKGFYDRLMDDLNVVLHKIYKDYGIGENKD